MNTHAYTITVELENEPGALVRVAQVFSRRGHNIDSLDVKAKPDDPEFSTMHISAKGSPERVEQITKQLQKLVKVRKVTLHENN